MYFLKSATLLVLMLCLVSTIYGQAKPSTITIKGQIFDQHPFYNNNFEPPGGSLTKNLVKSDIDKVNKIPVLRSLSKDDATNKEGRMVTPQLFESFYKSNLNGEGQSNSGFNKPIPYQIVLNLDENRGVYIFDNQKFFPIDGQGFDTDSYKTLKKYSDGNKNRNFHFCLKFNSRFTYGGYEEFNFNGDDDVWVFINDKLVVDLGGLHPREEGGVKLRNLGLTVKETYNFDFFYCERHTTASTIRIETNLETFCPYYDYCGVCSGDGSTCCNAAVHCDDNNPCTSDACPSGNVKIESGKTFKDYCKHTAVSCPKLDQCSNNACNTSSTSSSCVRTPIVCPDRSDECLIKKPCDNIKGCIYSQTCTGVCEAGCTTNSQGVITCKPKTPAMCALELDNDPCKEYYCGERGCASRPKCPQDPVNVCTINSCVVSNGIGQCQQKNLSASECKCGCDASDLCSKNNCVDNKCAPLPIDGIDDGNACTDDTCVNGVITHTLIDKCGGCSKCNTKTGDCDLITSVCDDGNECTDNTCSIDSVNSSSNYTLGVCSNSTVSCIPPSGEDKCKVYTCDSIAGCNVADRVCPDSGNCQVGFCDSKLGCQLKPRECISTAFCIVAECDESVGCISYERRCASDDGKCQRGVCVNGTETEEGECQSQDYDPLPFICKTAAVVSTAVVAGVVVAGAVALAAAIFGGKKGYDYWKESRNVSMSGSNSNPLYEQSQNAGVNPLYNDGAAN